MVAFALKDLQDAYDQGFRFPMLLLSVRFRFRISKVVVRYWNMGVSDHDLESASYADVQVLAFAEER